MNTGETTNWTVHCDSNDRFEFYLTMEPHQIPILSNVRTVNEAETKLCILGTVCNLFIMNPNQNEKIKEKYSILQFILFWLQNVRLTFFQS